LPCRRPIRSVRFQDSRAILFDYGGTLDADGERWPDRFFALYEEADLRIPRHEIKDAFYYAEDLCYADEGVDSLGLRPFMRHHVRLQFKALGLPDQGGADELADKFCARSEGSFVRARRLLQRVKPSFRLGIVSNFYGNLASVLKEAGLLDLLDVTIDSNRVGIRKPDPGIFLLALRELGLSPDQAVFVGDSYERDIVPASLLGMKTIWLRPPGSAAPLDQKADACVSRLSEIEALIV
jgi:FMN phosphatase YigB (HAD superfamily)